MEGFLLLEVATGKEKRRLADSRSAPENRKEMIDSRALEPLAAPGPRGCADRHNISKFKVHIAVATHRELAKQFITHNVQHHSVSSKLSNENNP